jgi:hypothetical protein
MTLPTPECKKPLSLRPAKRLGKELDAQLLAYVATASAAGVGMLALTQPAEGKIVYTPTHKIVQVNHAVPIVLNRDGIDDFDVFNRTHNSTTPFGTYLAAEPLQSGNQMLVTRTHRGFANYADALAAGVRIGAKAKTFAAGRNEMAFRSSGVSTVSGGPWKNVKNKFLGLKFLIKGKYHYGWARLNVSIVGHNIETTLTGYAYETIANKAIVAGATKGEATLDELAQGR